jgi:hypothetical protein
MKFAFRGYFHFIKIGIIQVLKVLGKACLSKLGTDDIAPVLFNNAVLTVFSTEGYLLIMMSTYMGVE